MLIGVDFTLVFLLCDYRCIFQISTEIQVLVDNFL